MTTTSPTCPFCGKPRPEANKTCGRAACRTKATVWAAKPAGGRAGR